MVWSTAGTRHILAANCGRHAIPNAFAYATLTALFLERPLSVRAAQDPR